MATTPATQISAARTPPASRTSWTTTIARGSARRRGRPSTRARPQRRRRRTRTTGRSRPRSRGGRGPSAPPRARARRARRSPGGATRTTRAARTQRQAPRRRSRRRSRRLLGAAVRDQVVEEDAPVIHVDDVRVRAEVRGPHCPRPRALSFSRRRERMRAEHALAAADERERDEPEVDDDLMRNRPRTCDPAQRNAKLDRGARARDLRDRRGGGRRARRRDDLDPVPVAGDEQPEPEQRDPPPGPERDVLHRPLYSRLTTRESEDAKGPPERAFRGRELPKLLPLLDSRLAPCELDRLDGRAARP